ncbi:MAG: trypsin-like serine protease [Oscillospiraceae bacterium]|nr:trypsin-like serine protease [Oscillospiraceae bacterium]
MRKTLARILGIVMAAVMISTSAYGTESSDTISSGSEHPDFLNTEEWDVRGSVTPNAETGGLTYIPPIDVLVEASVQSENGLIVSPGYDPYNEGDDEISTQAIIGSDDRTKVYNPNSEKRFRSTVYINVNLPNGMMTRATGFMIGPNAVATSGHVLCNYGFGKNGEWAWAESVDITPAYNTGTVPKPYGTVTANKYSFECGWGWAKNCDTNYDWGIITLSSNIGNQTGFWDVGYSNFNLWNGTSVLLNGYPKYIYEGEGPTRKEIFTTDQYLSTGTIGYTDEHFCYSYNLDASGGNSGGPCYIWTENLGYVAMGILQGGSTEWDSPNAYTTILYFDSTIYNKFLSYRTSTL